MKKIVLVGLFFSFPVSAGWFDQDPANYDECVLSMMGDKDKVLIYHARKACEKRFPFVRELKNDEADVSWGATDTGLILAPESKWSDYRIKQVTADFSTTPCGVEKPWGNITKTLSVSFISDGSYGEIETQERNFKCMSNKIIYGIVKPF
ncbi:hypothetical protein [Neptunomonas antarctica]|uniref:Uncharacterized protein n=1 Tax=Neptunomonas antarctica TaxID=619304 RepID=A0A1N7M970_9GAMM|nr:hypothetical protein [Neptunomonas antarctica]SIS82592.1 hypothetical protein SAMN05421760_105279 [Neptunomonas antarctica]